MGDDGEDARLAAAEAEEAEAPYDPFAIVDEYRFLTVSLDTETPLNVDSQSLVDKFVELYGDQAVVLRRAEVIDWFVEWPIEEPAPPESGKMKQLLQSGTSTADLPPELLAAAFTSKVATLSQAELQNIIDTKHRIAKAKEEKIERRKQMIEAGLPVDDTEDAKPEEVPPDLSTLVHMIFFKDYPLTLNELTVLQTGSWSDRKPAVRLHCTVTVNCAIPMGVRAQAATEVDPKKAGKPDAKKGKPDPKKKGKDAELADIPRESIHTLLRQECAELLKVHAQNELLDIYQTTYKIRQTWFGTQVEQNEEEVAESISAILEGLETERREYVAWCEDKLGREIDIPHMEGYEPRLPPPPKPEVEKAAEPPTKKGGGKKAKEEEQVPVEEPKPPVPVPAELPSSPAAIKCHRSHYDSLVNALPYAQASVPCVLLCAVEQTARNEECRRRVEEMRVLPEGEQEVHEAAYNKAKTVEVLVSDVEGMQQAHGREDCESAVSDYIDLLLGKLDGEEEVLHAMQIEQKRRRWEEREADLNKGASGTTSAATTARCFAVGSAVELTGLESDASGTRGYVIGHSRGRVGVQLVDGSTLGVLPNFLRLVPLSSVLPPDMMHTEDRVSQRSQCTEHVGRVKGRTTKDIEINALQLLAPTVIPLISDTLEAVVEAGKPKPKGTVTLTDNHHLHFTYADGTTETITPYDPQYFTRLEEVGPLEPGSAGKPLPLEEEPYEVPPLPDDVKDARLDELLTREQQAKESVVLAFEDLFHTRPGRPANERDSFADRVITEELDRLTFLQRVVEFTQLQDIDRLTCWLNQRERLGLLVYYQRVPEGRCRWKVSSAQFHGRIYFPAWLKWKRSVEEAERPPPPIPSANNLPPEDAEEDEEGEEAAEDLEAKASAGVLHREGSGAQDEEEGGEGTAGGREEGEEAKNATLPEDEEVLAQEATASPRSSMMKELRDKADLLLLKHLLAEGARQHLHIPHTPGVISEVREEISTLYPADGSVVTVTLAEGNTTSVRCTVLSGKTCVGFRAAIDDIPAKEENCTPAPPAAKSLTASEGDTNADDAEAVLPEGTNHHTSLPPVGTYRNPVYCIATFDDAATFAVMSSAELSGAVDGVKQGSLSVEVEYSLPTGVVVRQGSSGDVVMHPLADAPIEPPQQESPATANEPAPDFADAAGILDTLASAHLQSAAHLFTAADPSGNLRSVVARELSRRVVRGGTVIKTMQGGYTVHLMPNGNTAVVGPDGTWLTTSSKGRYVAPPTGSPFAVEAVLSTSNQDHETHAMVTTRSDLVTLVECGKGERGTVLVLHSDGTRMWSKKMIKIKGYGAADGLYARCGTPPDGYSRSDGAELRHTGKRWVCSMKGECLLESDDCPAGTGPQSAVWPAKPQETRTAAVVVLSQSRIEYPGYPSVEILKGEDEAQTQMLMPDGTILEWSDSPLPEAVLHRRDNTAIRVDFSTHQMTFQPPTLPADSADPARGLFVFSYLFGGMQMVDPDATTYEVTARGRTKIAHFNPVDANHPATEHDDRVVEEPLGSHFHAVLKYLGHTTTPPTGGKPVVPQNAPPQDMSKLAILRNPESRGEITVAHPAAGTSSLTPPTQTHRPKLYLLDMKKGVATEYFTVDDVLPFFRQVLGDAEASVQSTDGTPVNEITVLLPFRNADGVDTHLTDRLLPKGILARHKKKSKLRWDAVHGVEGGVKALAKDIHLQSSLMKNGTAGAAKLIRSLLKFQRVPESHRLLIRHRALEASEAKVVQEQYVENLLPTDDRTEEEKRDEAEVAARVVEKMGNQGSVKGEAKAQEEPEEDENEQLDLRDSAREPGRKTHSSIEGKAKEVEELQALPLAYWASEEGKAIWEECERERVARYKKPTPQPPPKDLKAEASPHGSAVARRESEAKRAAAEEQRDQEDLSELEGHLAHLEQIITAGVRKATVESAKMMLRATAPTSRYVAAVFECICIVLGVTPSWEKAQQVFTDHMLMQKLNQAAANRDWMPEGTLERLSVYYDDLVNARGGTTGVINLDLDPLARWVVSFMMYLKILSRLGGPAALGRQPPAVAVKEVPADLRGCEKDVYGRPRKHVPKVRALLKDTAYSDPNTAYLTRELGASRAVKHCGNRGDQEKCKELKGSLSSCKVMLNPLESNPQLKLVVTPPKLTFGSLAEGQRYSMDLVVTNVGQLGCRFIVKRVRSEVHEKINDFLSFVYKKGPVAPGMTCRVQAILAVDHVMPDIDEVVEIATESHIVAVPITATIRPGSEGGRLQPRKGVRVLGGLPLPVLSSDRR